MNNNMYKKKIIFGVILCFLSMLGTGCATIEPARSPINNYAKATKATTVVVGEYLSSLNQFERDKEYRFLVWQPDRALNVSQLQIIPFSEEGINVRLKVIKSLGKYGELLITLTDSDFTSQVDSAIAGLRTSLEDGIVTISNVTGGGENGKEYVAPLTQLLGIVTNNFIEKIREDGVKEAIKLAHPSILSIIDLMKSDMSIALDRREIGIDTLLAAASIRYTQFQKKNSSVLGQANATEAMRQDLLKSTRNLVNELELLKTTRGDVVGTLENFRIANDALAKYASSSSSDTELSEMILRVNLFLDSAESALSALDEIKAIK